MEILNVGPMELILIVLLMFILLGPTEMIRLTRQAGFLIRKASQSSFWKEMTKFSDEVQGLPTRLAREAGFKEQMEEIRETNRMLNARYEVDVDTPDEPVKAKSAYHQYRPSRVAARPPFEKQAQDTPPAASPDSPPPNPPADQRNDSNPSETMTSE